jgi:hypothetical protein
LHKFPHINPLEPCLSSMSDGINHALTYQTRNKTLCCRIYKEPITG